VRAPWQNFNSVRRRPFVFPLRLQQNMLAARIRVPTPIQKRAMPAIATGAHTSPRPLRCGMRVG